MREEYRRQESEVRSQKTGVRSQKTGVRSQNVECRIVEPRQVGGLIFNWGAGEISPGGNIT